MGNADALVGKLLSLLLVQHAAVRKPHIVLVPAHIPAPVGKVQKQVCSLCYWDCSAALCAVPSRETRLAAVQLAACQISAPSSARLPASDLPPKQQIALGHTRCTCLDGICTFSGCSRCPPATQGCSASKVSG